MNELVSVVLTTYARPHTLKRALDSLVSQTYNNLEIIVVDDNANKELNAEVESIVDGFNDSRIVVIKNEENLGGALSRNVGIEYSHGEYIAFLDDDDEYRNDKIEKQLLLEKESGNEKLALIFCYYNQYKSNGQLLKHIDSFHGNCVFDGMYDCIAPTSLWLCKKEALTDIGGFEDVPCKQDSNLIVRLLIKGYEVDCVKEFLVNYYCDAGARISNSSHEKRIVGEESLRALCRDNYELITKEQIDEVEYSFACRLAAHYLATKRFPQFFDALCCILRHPFRHKSLSAYKHILAGY